jgi:hypothetical protein
MKRRIALPIVLAAVLVAPLAACSAQSGAGLPSTSHEMPTPFTELDRGVVAEDSAAPATGSTSGSRADRSVIRTGDVSLEVADPRAAADEIAEVAERLDGGVESSTVRRAGGEVGDVGPGAAAAADVTIRVPEDRVDEAFEALSEVGEVLSQSRSEFDVTTEHVDLQARVAALEESVDRLTELMAGAATTSELLEAEAALSQRQQELDGLRAQLKSLEGQVDEATIHVSLQTRSALPGGGPANFWEGLLAGFGSLGAAGSGALVLAGILLPWLLVAAIVALGIVLIVRTARRRRARSADAAPQQPQHTQGPDQPTAQQPAAPDAAQHQPAQYPAGHSPAAQQPPAQYPPAPTSEP